jgi:hypothetical protein
MMSGSAPKPLGSLEGEGVGVELLFSPAPCNAVEGMVLKANRIGERADLNTLQLCKGSLMLNLKSMTNSKPLTVYENDLR